jgi:hypothetical protein
VEIGKINEDVILKWKIVLGLDIAQAKGVGKNFQRQSSNTPPGVSFLPFRQFAQPHGHPPPSFYATLQNRQNGHFGA